MAPEWKTAKEVSGRRLPTLSLYSNIQFMRTAYVTRYKRFRVRIVRPSDIRQKKFVKPLRTSFSTVRTDSYRPKSLS